MVHKLNGMKTIAKNRKKMDLGFLLKKMAEDKAFVSKKVAEGKEHEIGRKYKLA